MATQDLLAAPKPAPNLNIPSSSSTVTVSIIDSTGRLEVAVVSLMGPPIPNHTTMKAPAYSFLITHAPTSRKVLFDLGARKDPQNLAPAVLPLLTLPGSVFAVEKNVADILEENGVDVGGGEIASIIWSHWHLDHTGDPSTFPTSTGLIVGPGFKDAFLPAYPTNPESPLLESDFDGREVREIGFDGKLKIGGFKAFDFFEDGSFYLLDSPGHALGHMCGLARVTTGKQETGLEDTFVLMGGDACHYSGEFRPTEYLPLPRTISPSPLRGGVTCLGAMFERVHPETDPTKPFYRIADTGAHHDIVAAEQTILNVEEFDAADNVLVVVAHDPSLLEENSGVEFFPHGTLNGWKTRSVATKVRWTFLKDFEDAVREVKDEKKI